MSTPLSKKVTLWLFVLLLAWGYIPAQAQTCGLVSNAGFENDFTGWASSGGATIVSDAHSGSKAVRIGTAQGGVNSAGTFAVTAGQQVNFQIWAKVSGSPVWAGVGVDFLDASGAEISEIVLQITATSYTQRTATQAAPAGTTQARIWTWKTGSAGNLFIDDVCLSVPDTQAPSVPSGLASSAITQTSFTLNWSASTDNVGVTGYEVLRNGTSAGTPSGTSFNVTGLSAGTTYAMRVRARDEAGNWSAQSSTLNVTTTAAVTSCGSITNNGFENGLTGWTNNGNTSITSDARTGSSAASTGTGEGGIHYGSLVPASGGQTVNFRVWAKVAGSPSWAGVGIDYLDASGNELSESVLTVTSSSYTEYVVNGTAPAGTANINVWTWKSGTTGNLILDDFCLTVSGTTNPNFTVTINKAQQHQTIDGFGFFGAQNVWWSSPSSLWSDSWGEQVISDLGITIWRTEHYPPSDNLHTQDADWNKQLPVVRGLRDKAAQHGVDLKFIFTVWSPPSSMKVKVENNTRMIGVPHPDGTKNGGALDPTKYTQFANFLKEGIARFEAEGIDVYAISPQNEPFFVHSFNSCWYKQEWYPEMLVNTIPQVKATYPDVRIFGSEGMLEMEAADHNWQWFYHKQILDNSQARNNVDILAVHGYQDGVAPSSGSVLGHYWNNHRTIFAEPMGKKQWMTETSGYDDTWEGEPGAFALALDIMSALNNGNVAGWVWWQGSENPGSSNIGEFALMNGLVKGKKYYASKQFYRYIRPGAVRITGTSTNSNVSVSSYFHPQQGTHTIVLANSSGSAQTITVGGAGLPSSFTVFRTSATDNCVNAGSYTTGANLTLPARSLITLQAGGTPLATASSATARKAQASPVANESSSLVKVYPNAVKQKPLTIDLSEVQTSGVVKVDLLDLSGNVIRSYEAAGKKLEIAREDLPAKGVYILSVNNGSSVERVKVVME